ncbi:uncharacterized protein LOC128866034 [Anastrepha ludens]|uniref:uncharacterized protein LOC128866034 n=1 Tax=Anastrepha ludens TaxID=28586 RepID=UPI0023AEAF31|nr:uncharacterized protein LOC128866034 [Anastrepha ludens]
MAGKRSRVEEPSTSVGGKKRKVKGSWNLMRIMSELGTNEQCVKFAEDNGLIPKTMVCSVHKTFMNFRRNGNKVGYFLCSRGTCRKKSCISRATGTWFENARLSLPHIYYLMYCFAHRFTEEAVIREDFILDGTSISTSTIVDWFGFCREAVISYQLDHQEYSGKIGGPGKIVQIGESKFGTIKYNKLRNIESHWALRMVENNCTDLRFELCPENDCSFEDIIPLIEKHVLKGSIIQMDSREVNDRLQEHGYLVAKAKHGEAIDPLATEDGNRREQIESQARLVRRLFNAKFHNTSGNFGDIITEYIWRRSIKTNKKDAFLALVEAIKYVYNEN